MDGLRTGYYVRLCLNDKARRVSLPVVPLSQLAVAPRAMAGKPVFT
jgi:hypothetical protein